MPRLKCTTDSGPQVNKCGRPGRVPVFRFSPFKDPPERLKWVTAFGVSLELFHRSPQYAAAAG